MINSSKKFSLIELLIILSILLIITSLVSPSLNKMLRSAHETLCANGIRDLLISTHVYAEDSNGHFMDLAYSPTSKTKINTLYWTHGYWRKYLTENFQLNREHFYSPTNEKWNDDSFYFYNKGYQMIMGRFYFGSQSRQGQIHNAMPAAKRGLPTFASRNFDSPSQLVLWTDLNRKWQGYFLNPDDINRRQGSNHLYDPDAQWPSLSHNGLVDGSLEIPDQYEVSYQMTFANVEYHW